MSSPFKKKRKPYWRTLNVTSGYKKWSVVYDRKKFHELDVDLLANLETVKWSEMENIVDIGCGTGLITEWLRKRNNNFIAGIDLSPEMLAVAAEKKIYDKLIEGDFLKHNLSESKYDLAISSLVVSHIEDLRAFYTQSAKAIRKNGYFIVIGFHPFFLLNGIGTTFADQKGKAYYIENMVHLFGDHFKEASQLNLKLEGFSERLVDTKLVKKASFLKKYRNCPISFLMLWKKS